jgi:hypothetical protein
VPLLECFRNENAPMADRRAGPFNALLISVVGSLRRNEDRKLFIADLKTRGEM